MNLNELFGKTAGNAKLNPVSDSQWNTYMRLCNQKFVTRKERSEFSSSSISSEIERLMRLPFARKAFPQQIARFKDMCKELNIKCPADEVMDTWSNVEISARMSVLGKKLPITDGQIRRLKDLFRFGLIVEEALAGVNNQTAASDLITAHQDALMQASEGKLTLNQAERIIQLESDLHHKELNIVELSSMTFDEASARIDVLKKEQEDRRDALKLGWDNSGGFYEGTDTSRNRDAEDNDALSFGDKDLNQKISIIRKLQNIVNVGNDNLDEINNNNADDMIIELYELAAVIGEKQAAYSVMQSALEEGEPTEKETKSRRRSRSRK